MSRGRDQHPVIFDVDGVLANFDERWCRFLRDEMFLHVPADFRRAHWDHEPPGVTSDIVDQAWQKIKRHKDFWVTANPLLFDETFDRIDGLSRVTDVYFVTSRPGRQAKEQTEDWLTNHGISFPTVIISNKKGEVARAINAKWAIDDKAGNTVYGAYESPKTQWVILDRPYNQFDPLVLGSKVKRAHTVDEFLDWVVAA